MNNKGIDYGNGQTNIDPETGIRYGVISASAVEWWYEEAEADYGEPTCPKCGNDKRQELSYLPIHDADDLCSDWRCDNCGHFFSAEEAFGDSLGWVYQFDGYIAHQNGDDADIFVTKSPYYTRAQFCSPCAPGACHLEHPMPEDEKAYCFGHDWFEDGIAPYPVYRVSDNSPLCNHIPFGE